MEHIERVVSSMLLSSAVDWITERSEFPDPKLEPEFDIDDQARRYAKKLRKLTQFDMPFWGNWIEQSGIQKLAGMRLSKPLLLKHAAFIKRAMDESYIPLHQDIVSWEYPFSTGITIWVALTDCRKEHGGLFYLPDDSTIHEHVMDLRYPSFKCLTPEFAKGVKWDHLRDLDANAGDVLIWPGHTAHGSHEKLLGGVRIAMPLVYIEESEFYKFMEQDMDAWVRANLEDLLGDRRITTGAVGDCLKQLTSHSLKMVTFLARFKRHFGYAPKIVDFLASPNLQTLLGDAASRYLRK
jgi:hypothetical protein